MLFSIFVGGAMKFKKTVSLLVIISLLAGILSSPVLSFAEGVKAIDSFAEKLDALNDFAQAEKLNTEQMIEARVIVSSAKQLIPFGDAKYIKGYRDLYVFQYSSEAEAEKAVEYYNGICYVKWAQIDTVHRAKTYTPSEDSVKIGLKYLSESVADMPRVDVAVIDTGINVRLSYSGEQNGGRLINSGYNVSNSGIFYSAEDDEGHGTKVCSVLLNNSPDNVFITGYKALDNTGEGDDLAVAMCIDKAVADGNSIINLSLGGEGETEPCLKEALQRAFDAGVMVVVAAGNECVDVSSCNPACEEKAVCVAAIDDYGNPESYSNYGEGVDFAAPGNIYGGGTSFSAPYISAVAASIKSVHPDYSSERIEQEMKNSCYSFEQLNWHDSIHRIEGVVFEDLVSYDDDYKTFAQYINPCEDEKLYYGSGMPNFALAVGMEQCEEVEFSIVPGHYQIDDLNLTLSSEEGSTIYYTDDGSFPSVASNVFTPLGSEGQPQSIPIEGIYAIRAVAYQDGKAPSIISFGEYFNEHLADESDFTIDTRGVLRSYNGTLTSVIVPSSVNGVTLTNIDTNFNTPNTSLTCLTLPQTITNWWNRNTDFSVFDSLLYFKAQGLSIIPENCFYNRAICVCDTPNVRTIGKFAFAKTNIKTADFPYASVSNGAFFGCKYLESADFSLNAQSGMSYHTVQQQAFYNCIRLRSIKLNPDLKEITVDKYAFCNCYSLRGFDFSKVKFIYESAFANVRGIKAVIAPNLEYCASLPYSTELLYAPVVVQIIALPFGLNPLAVVSRWSYVINGNGFLYNLVYYPTFPHNLGGLVVGTVEENTRVRSYAGENNFSVLNLPAVVSEPENMGEAGGVLSADVIGINLSYQWYGSDVRNNRSGALLDGETSRELDSSKYQYRYYYCEATHYEEKPNSAEPNIIKTVKTGYTGEDINCDDIVDIADVSLILANLTSSIDTGNDACDVDRNSIIDMSDLSALLLSDVYGKKQTLSALDLPAWQYMYDCGKILV